MMSLLSQQQASLLLRQQQQLYNNHHRRRRVVVAVFDDALLHFRWICSITTTKTTTKYPSTAAVSHYYHPQQQQQQRYFSSSSFSFPGPRKLQDILQMDKLEHASRDTIIDVWTTYHNQDKKNVFGMIQNGTSGLQILERAKKCPFYIQAMFPDHVVVQPSQQSEATTTTASSHKPEQQEKDSYVMLVSQFVAPCHFLVTYLADYQSNPSAAVPWMTCSIFTEYSSSSSTGTTHQQQWQYPHHDLTLIRGDIINTANIVSSKMGQEICTGLLHSYTNDYTNVEIFNQQPNQYNISNAIQQMKRQWSLSSSLSSSSLDNHAQQQEQH